MVGIATVLRARPPLLLPDAGHLVTLDPPDAIVRAVRTLLDLDDPQVPS